MTDGATFCGALDLERKALDFYEGARRSSPSNLGRQVFGILAEDKRRTATRLAEITAALTQGASTEDACALVEDDAAVMDVFAELASMHGIETPSDGSELELISAALAVERDCLGYLEHRLRAEADPWVRSFLQRAIEEERAHFVLLSDMRYHFEQALD